MDAPDLWTYRVGLNVARRSGRRAARERGLWASADRPSIDESGSDTALWLAVAALPERQRQAVVLRYLFDLTQAQIAHEMGLAPGTVAGDTLRGFLSFSGAGDGDACSMSRVCRAPLVVPVTSSGRTRVAYGRRPTEAHP